MTKALLGVIGGSGVYDLPGLEDVREEIVATPWGEPSDALRFGRIGTTEAVFLPRHGRGHRLSPSGVNYRANIDALKRVGVTDVISVSACGSFREELPPGLFVAVDQFVDRTFGRQSSFFGNGCVAHVSMAHPVAPLLQQRIVAAAHAEKIEIFKGGTYVCMEGPQFSSRAESLGYKAAGHHVIGMTALPEAKLAREAEMSYATLAMVTDFDCWREDDAAVEVHNIRRRHALQRRKGRAPARPADAGFPRRTSALPDRLRPRAGPRPHHRARRLGSGTAEKTRRHSRARSGQEVSGRAFSRRAFLAGSAALATIARDRAEARAQAPDPHIEDLLRQMTLEEKAAQLSIFRSPTSSAAINPQGPHEPTREQALADARRGLAAGFFNGFDPAFNREAQRLAVEESRLRIPLIFAADVIHGLRTTFPIPLAEAASFDPELCRRTARASAEEATALGLHWTFAPMVDVARDERWGRVMEGAGEDPWLGARIAAARVRGFQGDDLRVGKFAARLSQTFRRLWRRRGRHGI